MARSSLFDAETKFYYLQSRYYDPELGRFINADTFASTGQGILGNNMFAYCGNNPISFSDPSGHARKQLPFCLNDDLGYIYDQHDNPWGDMQLGSSTVGKMGCGLVAIFNAMITLGDPRPFSEIYDFFDSYPSGLMDHGKHGLFVGYVAAYFFHEGYDVVIGSSYDIDQFIRYAESADACILLYQAGEIFKPYGHYVEFSKYPGGYIGRNTAEDYGVFVFESPVEYGYAEDRFFFFGVFVYKPN